MPRGVKNARDKRAVREAAVEEPGASLYGRVTSMLGNGRMRVSCSDGSERLARIRGNMRRRDYIRAGDMVLVSLREFQQDKVDVVFKYSSAEAAQLQKYDTTFARLALEHGGRDGDEEDVVVFAEEDVQLSLI